MMAYGQESSTAVVDNNVKKKTCTPTKECAAKAGMTQAECKAYVKKHCSSEKATKTASVDSPTTVLASVEEKSSDNKKTACGSGKATKMASIDSPTIVLTSMEEKSPGNKKAACCSVEECAALLGITVEECLARCKNACASKAKTASSTKVASAVMVSDPPKAKTKEVKCATAVKACGSKSKN